MSVETQDDVVLEGNTISLYQLKHSLNPPEQSPRLTIANVGFWKTISIWANTPNICSKKFVFVTTAAIAPNCSLNLLRKANSDRTEVVTDLIAEAKRVVAEVQSAKTAGKTPLPHKERLSGCEAYLNKLTPQQQADLVDRIIIQPEIFNALQVQDEVESRLTKVVPLNMRKQVAERLIE